MNEPKFKMGDKVTFKDRETLPNQMYYYRGENQAGITGIVSDVCNFKLSTNCYEIEVDFIDNKGNNNSFTMLESEFEEYDSPKYNIENLPKSWLTDNSELICNVLLEAYKNSDYFESNKKEIETYRLENFGFIGSFLNMERTIDINCKSTFISKYYSNEELISILKGTYKEKTIQEEHCCIDTLPEKWYTDKTPEICDFLLKIYNHEINVATEIINYRNDSEYKCIGNLGNYHAPITIQTKVVFENCRCTFLTGDQVIKILTMKKEEVIKEKLYDSSIYPEIKELVPQETSFSNITKQQSNPNKFFKF